MPFEVELGAMHGHISTAVLDPAGVNPRTIIKMTDPWRLRVDWSLHGPLVPMIDGDWRVTAYLESMGPGPEITLGTAVIDIGSGGTPDALGLEYQHTFNLAPNTPNVAGAYKLVTVITSVSETGLPGPFAAFDEGPILQFYP